jgi:hypothetical protein
MAVYAEHTRALGELHLAYGTMIDAYTRYEKVYNASERRLVAMAARRQNE